MVSRTSSRCVSAQLVLNSLISPSVVSGEAKVEDFNRSWKDGTAFVALLKSWRPELIDARFAKAPAEEKLRKVFELAEKHLGTVLFPYNADLLTDIALLGITALDAQKIKESDSDCTFELMTYILNWHANYLTWQKQKETGTGKEPTRGRHQTCLLLEEGNKVDSSSEAAKEIDKIIAEIASSNPRLDVVRVSFG